MKRFSLLISVLFAISLKMMGMSYERAREEAFYLTDKMAYELNLNDQQYNDAYEINLDYLLSLDSEADLYGDYMHYRLADLQYILYDWQYQLLLAADYFLHPVVWRPTGWYFPVYSYYSRRHFFFDRPRVFWDYRGGHGRMHHRGGMYYSNRRPEWNGGMRGMDRNDVRRSGHMGDMRTRSGREFREDTRNSLSDETGGTLRSQTRGNLERSGREIRGNGFRMTLPNRESQRSQATTNSNPSSSRGNSFTRSSSRQATGSLRNSTRSRDSFAGSSSRSIDAPSRSMSGSPSRGMSGSSTRSMGTPSHSIGRSSTRSMSNSSTRSGGMGGGHRGGGRGSR